MGMKLNNWMQDASNEITAQQIELGRLSRVDVPAIIAKHCPFKPDVAYMPVPRCDSCARWARPDPKQDGICTLWKGNQIVVTTSADYGCVRWEAK